jgi:segregation and condensation protein B
MARAKKKQTEEIVEQVTEEISAEAPQEIILSDEEVAEIVSCLAPSEEVAEVAVTETAEEAPAAVAGENAPSAEAPAEELPMTPEDVRLVEAILFATSTALTVGQISERFPRERVSLIPDVLEHLKEQYSTRGVNLVQRESRWAFRTATDLGDQLRLEKEQPKKFTRAAMETMAVIAYHQPVTRAEIENIRGVTTSPGALDALMEAGWIKPGKRREVPGRPVTWLSTQAFLDHFGLERLEDLPGMDELKAAGLLDKRPAIEAMPTADMFGEDENKQETMEDPQEVTDEDLIGKVEGKESAESVEASEDDGADDDAEASEDEDFDDEDSDESDDDDSDDEDADSDDDDEEASDDDDDEEASDDDDDEEASDDDEDSDDEEDDSDDDGEEASDDDEDLDDEDEDFDDEDGDDDDSDEETEEGGDE